MKGAPVSQPPPPPRGQLKQKPSGKQRKVGALELSYPRGKMREPGVFLHQSLSDFG